MNANLKNLVLAGSSLAQALALASTVHGAPASAGPSLVSEHAPSAAQINQLSLSAIEKSFLAVPHHCKDRSASFDPMIVDREEISAAAQAAHAELDAQAVEA